MGIVTFEDEVSFRPEVASVTLRFFDTGALDIIRLGEHGPEDIATWPALSLRPTTSESATALEERTAPDTEPRLPDVEIDDGLGL
jgi:hypothetical protein